MFARIPDIARKNAELYPGAQAFLTEERNWTFADVNRAADGFATALTGIGLNRGDRLAFLSLNRVEFFIALFACQKSGVIFCPLNWRQPAKELCDVLASVGAAAIIYDDENATTARELAERLTLSKIAIGGAQQDASRFGELIEEDAFVSRSIDADAPWYLLFTSGTTGLPKAVTYAARMAWAHALNITQAVTLRPDDKSINFLPLFHTGGINLFTLPIFLFGGCSIILPRFDPGEVLERLTEGDITKFFAVPAIYQAFSLHDQVDSVNWRDLWMGCGGAPLPEKLIRFFIERGGRICNGFGMTETGGSGFLMNRAMAETKIGSVGKPMSLVDVRLDGVEDGAPGEGEIQLRGPAMSGGYFNNEAATQGLSSTDGWLRTGDVGRRDAEGYYFIVDRIKDMFISGGENVYPAEVERVLGQHPDILEAAVIGVADDKWGEVGAAFLLARPGREIDMASLTPWARERLAAYKVPKTFHAMSEFPRTAAGKVKKPDLRTLMNDV